MYKFPTEDNIITPSQDEISSKRERVKLRMFCASTTAQSDSKIIYVHKIIMQRIIINIYNIIL